MVIAAGFVRDILAALPFLDNPIVLLLALALVEAWVRSCWKQAALRKENAELRQRVKRSESAVARLTQRNQAWSSFINDLQEYIATKRLDR
jgi:hypothetical protein